MADFVLDASVALSWCFPGDPTEDTPYSRRILAQLATNDAIVPGYGRLRSLTLFFVACNKRKRITQRQADEYLRRLQALPIRVEHTDLWENVALESQARR